MHHYLYNICRYMKSVLVELRFNVPQGLWLFLENKKQTRTQSTAHSLSLSVTVFI